MLGRTVAGEGEIDIHGGCQRAAQVRAPSLRASRAARGTSGNEASAVGARLRRLPRPAPHVHDDLDGPTLEREHHVLLDGAAYFTVTEGQVGTGVQQAYDHNLTILFDLAMGALPERRHACAPARRARRPPAAPWPCSTSPRTPPRVAAPTRRPARRRRGDRLPGPVPRATAPPSARPTAARSRSNTCNRPLTAQRGNVRAAGHHASTCWAVA